MGKRLHSNELSIDIDGAASHGRAMNHTPIHAINCDKSGHTLKGHHHCRVMDERAPPDGALEELLALHRQFIDEAIYPLAEDSDIEHVGREFEARLRLLARTEPRVWELKMTQYIYDFARSKLRESVCQDEEKADDPAEDTHETAMHKPSAAASVQQQEIVDTVRRAVQRELCRILAATDDDGDYNGSGDGGDQKAEHVLERLWAKVEPVVEALASDEHEIREATDAYSFDAIAFEDLQDELGSASSGPTLEDIPGILGTLETGDADAQALAISQIAQMAAMELVHCGYHFQSLFTAVVNQLVHAVHSSTRCTAACIIYNVLECVEDPQQFWDIYVAVIDCICTSLENGLSGVTVSVHALQDTENSPMDAINVFRVLVLLLRRVPHHWIHFSIENLARLLLATFQMLVVGESGHANIVPPWVLATLIDTESSWLRKWLLKVPNRAQLIVSIEESGFLRMLVAASKTPASAGPFGVYVTQQASHLLELVSEHAATRLVIQRLCGMTSGYKTSKVEREKFKCVHTLEMESLQEENDRIYHFKHRPQQTAYVSPETIDISELVSMKYEDLWTSGRVIPLLSSPQAARQLLSDQRLIQLHRDSLAELAANVDCTVAIHSSSDECPFRLRSAMGFLANLKCVMSSQFASTAVVETPYWLNYVQTILQDHWSGKCCRSSVSEDLCCVAMELLIAINSSVVAIFRSHTFMSSIVVAQTDVEDASSVHGISSCGYLEKQLIELVQQVGGSAEKGSPTILSDVTQSITLPSAPNHEERSVHKIKATIQSTVDGIRELMESGNSNGIDVVGLSQSTWELLSDLEHMIDYRADTVQSYAEFYSAVCGDVLYHIALASCSLWAEAQGGHSWALQSDNSSSIAFPSDAERQLCNQLYKSYCKRLRLKSTPTLLHCLVKHFGKCAIDCFPVTMLIILDQLGKTEREIINFLTACEASPVSFFLWPRLRSASLEPPQSDEIETIIASGIAEAAEYIICKEFPQAQCSILALVVRWQSQCYWNYLNWPEIIKYLLMTFLYGNEFQVYFVVAALRHIEPQIKEICASHVSSSGLPLNPVAFLKVMQLPISGFSFSINRSFFSRLRGDYHTQVATILEQVGTTVMANERTTSA
ncbi:TPA: hypothetical protein N0F65_002337 [Lagenidium giganteum]|uniref:BROMI C-terminal Rab TBC-like domain-containing protein n=1 Tax=Lagenidium giganteum TaxID=4803 RepID=A0AAV2Z675_9STRA|nr:TPA: hypothetical protein N0F65_002337 [Lagenidium giganteum]